MSTRTTATAASGKISLLPAAWSARSGPSSQSRSELTRMWASSHCAGCVRGALALPRVKGRTPLMMMASAQRSRCALCALNLRHARSGHCGYPTLFVGHSAPAVTAVAWLRHNSVFVQVEPPPRFTGID
jgi:LSD1 subclass zinc finger protein